MMLFSSTVRSLQEKGYPDNFKLHTDLFDKHVEILRQHLQIAYESNNEDIEDFCDLIQMVNLCTENVIIDSDYSNFETLKMLRVRIESKKLIKKKYREFKYEERLFFNHEEAYQQFAEFLQYVWKPSVIHIEKLCMEHRNW